MQRHVVTPKRPWAKAVGFTACLAGLVMLVLEVAACATDAIGVEACRKIERVRCESAPACGISLRSPLHTGSEASNDVAACIRYYDDQCLHGLSVAREPAPQAVDACVDAIIGGTCDVVAKPQSSPACAFLEPPVAPPPAADATTDAAADGPSGR